MSVDVEQPRTDKRLRMPSVATLLCFTAVLLAVALYFFVVSPFVNRVAMIREVIRQQGRVQFRERGPDWLRTATGYYRLYDIPSNPKFGLLDEVVMVDLNRTEITNEFIPKLWLFRSLEELDLSRTKVTDDCLPAVAEFSELKYLHLGHCRVSGRGFGRLRGMESLTSLGLTFTPIRDGALQYLDGHPSLNWMHIYGCRHLTPDRVDEFVNRNPSVKLEGREFIEHLRVRERRKLEKRGGN